MALSALSAANLSVYCRDRVGNWFKVSRSSQRQHYHAGINITTPTKTDLHLGALEIIQVGELVTVSNGDC